MASAGGGWLGERHAGGVANRARCLFCGSATGPFVEPDWLFRARACMACQPGHRVGQGSKRLDHEQPKHRLMQDASIVSSRLGGFVPRFARQGGEFVERRVGQ